MTLESDDSKDNNQQVTCRACNQVIKAEDKICPYCGFSQEETGFELSQGSQFSQNTDIQDINKDIDINFSAEDNKNKSNQSNDIESTVVDFPENNPVPNHPANSDDLVTLDDIIAYQNQTTNQTTNPNTIKHGRDKLNFSLIIIWGCILMYVITLATSGNIENSGVMNMLRPSNGSLFAFGATGSYPVFAKGRWWTVLSAAWLHGNFIHIAFNLAFINQLAPLVRQTFGSKKLVIIYTISTITSALLTSTVGQYNLILPQMLKGAELSVGASGGIFGLLAALVAYGQITGNSAARKQFWTFALVNFLIGFIIPQVDNWGHLGGFLGGYVASFIPGLRPNAKENRVHFTLAIACIVAVVLSIFLPLIPVIIFILSSYPLS